MVAVVWFRRDLRIEDNIALKHALEESDEVFLLFHVNPAQRIGADSLNEAAFFNQVHTFRQEISKQHGTLHILYGDLNSSFIKLKEALPSWSTIYINRDESGYGLERDKKAANIFKQIGVKAYGFHDHYLHSAKEINTAANTPYKVFTPYFNKWKERAKPTVVEVAFDATKIRHSPVFFRGCKGFRSFARHSSLHAPHRIRYTSRTRTFRVLYSTTHPGLQRNTRLSYA